MRTDLFLSIDKVAVFCQIFPIGMFQCLVRSSSLSVKAVAAAEKAVLAEAGLNSRPCSSLLPVRVFYFLL